MSRSPSRCDGQRLDILTCVNCRYVSVYGRLGRLANRNAGLAKKTIPYAKILKC